MQRASHALFSSLRGGKSDNDAPPTTSNGTKVESSDKDARQLVEALERKRRQLDEEIEKFKEEKEREFKAFEKELRVSRSNKHGTRNGHEGRGTGVTTPTQNGLTTGNSSESERGSEETSGRGNSTTPSSSDRKRTTSISELTGSLSQLDTAELHKSNQAQEHTAHQQAGLGPSTPSAYDKDVDFHGLFTPHYLPLIDKKQRGDGEHSPHRSPRLDIPIQGASRLSPANSSSSFPPRSTIIPTSHSSKAKPVPSSQPSPRSSLASTSLPSALRTPSNERKEGKKSRSPKRVLFQLANAIVQPGICYEEPKPADLPRTIVPVMPSTSEESTNTNSPNTPQSSQSSGRSRLSTPPKIDLPREETPASPLSSNSSDETKSFSRKPSSPPTPHVNVNGRSRSQPSENASSYFDKAMSSSTGAPHSPLRPLANPPGDSGDPMFDLDEDLDSPTRKYGEVEETKDKPKLEEDDLEPDAPNQLGGQSGSLPIDIVRPFRRF